MANTVRIKRRAAGGAAGAPASLANAELAFNEQDNVLYYGTGTGGAGGTATSVIAIAGPGWAAPLASPAFTGTPTAPTAATSTNTTQIATTAFVLGQANSTAGTIAMNGSQAAGSSNLYARADHVHPTDTSRAPLASPTFTGLVTLPAGSASQAGGVKLTSGTVKTSPVAGDSGGVEYDGTAVYVINSAGTRQTFAYLASPTFTGTPAAPTAAVDTNTTQLATTAYVVGQGYLKSATASSTYAPLASPTFTGVPAAPTAAVDTNTTQLATTAYVIGQGYLKSATASSTYAPLASPALTGAPTSTTAAVDTNTTQIATTAFVLAQAASATPAALGTAAVGTSTRYARGDHVHAMPTLSQVGTPTANVSMGSFRITSLADPTAATDAATKQYVDNVAQGLDAKQSVKCATTANITLSGLQTIDGITVVANDRVLVKNQNTASQNGIYLASASAWTRATDMDTWAEVPNAFTFVEQGTTQADTSWVCSSDQGGTLDTTSITFFQFGAASAYLAGNGLQLSGNTFSVLANGSSINVSASGIQIASTYAGQTSITTLGTIATGTWNGSTITVPYGGTGATSLTGYVKGNGTSAMTASATIPNTDISGLGTMSTQAASGVAITGGSITNLTTFDGVTIDGGTF